MQGMDGPHGYHNVHERSIDSSGWTEECQGVAWDGANWIFSSNGSQPIDGVVIGNMPKALYTFPGHADLNDDDSISHTFVLADADGQARIPGPPGGGPIYHVGSIAYLAGNLYVDHWNEQSGGALVVLKADNGVLSFSHWIRLQSPVGERVNLVAIDPGSGQIYTSKGSTNVSQVYVHRADGTPLPDRHGSPTVLTLRPPITDGCYVQGGAFSAHGHLYVSSGRSGFRPHQYVYIYSALNGQLMDTITILTEGLAQELEGLCLADLVHAGGIPVQLHVVLLDNNTLQRDNMFFKQLASADPTTQ
jgi:hypothetical protein